MKFDISTERNLSKSDIISLYKANNWSSADKPDQLYQGLLNSHSLVTVWHRSKLVGLGNAISDGHLVVYYPHLLVHPEYHKKGIGKLIVQRMQELYGDFHQQILVADEGAIQFYQKCGFIKAGETQSMWIYSGNDT